MQLREPGGSRIVPMISHMGYHARVQTAILLVRRGLPRVAAGRCGLARACRGRACAGRAPLLALAVAVARTAPLGRLRLRVARDSREAGRSNDATEARHRGAAGRSAKSGPGVTRFLGNGAGEAAG